MTIHYHFTPISASFWRDAAKQFLSDYAHLNFGLDAEQSSYQDFSMVRVVVPTFEHAHLFLQAISQELNQKLNPSLEEQRQVQFIPPRIQTMFAWMGMQLPQGQSASALSERLMTIYDELRQHTWLKKLFSAKRNTDLMPLAQTLLTLSDELTQVWLPQALINQNAIENNWLAALANLPMPVQKICSDETQLVWTIWQSQLDARDKVGQEFTTMMDIANQAKEPLLWIAPTAPNVLENAFLQRYQEQQTVICFSIDWRATALDKRLCLAWPELSDATLSHAQHAFVMDEVNDLNNISKISNMSNMSRHEVSMPVMDFSQLQMYGAVSLEDEAEQAAQTIINWLQSGKQPIAVIAQDRVVSRRLRALLERAQVRVADETGWKLSTTRAAACLAAWFEVISSRADTIALVDFIKSPFVQRDDKENLLMRIELTLRKNNVLGGWESILYALNDKVDDDNNEASAMRQWIADIAGIAHYYHNGVSNKTLKDWTASTLQAILDLGLQNTLQNDLAGMQILQILQAVQVDCGKMAGNFSFSEWRALINMQMESTPFTVTHLDKRVVMLPLNGARLRHFDAVYLIGGDESHLPSKAKETLFFTNAVRRECGLVTREERQQQQLRDFAEVILSNKNVVVSWQTKINGEYNAVSPWIEQVNLMLQRQRLPTLKMADKISTPHILKTQTVHQAMPSAAQLLPDTLSSSGLSSLFACPYQFFAGRMLKLSAIDELSDMPEKRDYGDWLHAILKTYHDKILSDNIQSEAEREATLRDISATFFTRVLKKSPAALGYSVRWNKVIPAYLAWANGREKEGWQFVMGESWAEQALDWRNDGLQGSVLLRGRIDRIDRVDRIDKAYSDDGAENTETIEQKNSSQSDAQYAVLDYKTKTLSSLKKRLKEEEDHQLAFYGLLSAQNVQEACYVALELEKDKIGNAEANQFIQRKNALESAIKMNMQAIQSNQALKAQGVESVCQYCDKRGLCRKGAWS